MHWRRVLTYDLHPTILEFDGVGVVRLSERVDGSWFALLDYHLGHDPRRTRNCTSLEAGRAGAEVWATRHAERLRRETAEVRSRCIMLPGRGNTYTINVRPPGWRVRGRNWPEMTPDELARVNCWVPDDGPPLDE